MKYLVCVNVVALLLLCACRQQSPSPRNAPVTPEIVLRQYYEYIWNRANRIEIAKSEDEDDDPSIEVSFAVIEGDDFRRLADAALKSGRVIEGSPCKSPSFETHYRLSLFDADRRIATFSSDWQWKINLENTCDFEFFIDTDDRFWELLNNADYKTRRPE